MEDSRVLSSFFFPGILASGDSRHDDRCRPLLHASPCGNHTTGSAPACDLHHLNVASLELGPHLFPHITLFRTARHDAGTMFFDPCARGQVCRCVGTLDRSTASFARVLRREHHPRRYELDALSALCCPDDDGRRDDTHAATDETRVLVSLDGGARRQCIGECAGGLTV
jgi:hypothetical protein